MCNRLVRCVHPRVRIYRRTTVVLHHHNTTPPIPSTTSLICRHLSTHTSTTPRSCTRRRLRRPCKIVVVAIPQCSRLALTNRPVMHHPRCRCCRPRNLLCRHCHRNQPLSLAVAVALVVHAVPLNRMNSSALPRSATISTAIERRWTKEHQHHNSFSGRPVPTVTVHRLWE